MQNFYVIRGMILNGDEPPVEMCIPKIRLSVIGKETEQWR